MTSLKTSIKTITYLSDTGCLEIQGASLLFTNRVFLIGLIIAQLALVIVLSAMIQKLSAGVTTMLFMLYSALTGCSAQ